jgi:hypothetical protein
MATGPLLLEDNMGLSRDDCSVLLGLSAEMRTKEEALRSGTTRFEDGAEDEATLAVRMTGACWLFALDRG